MKLLSLQSHAFRGLPDGTYDFAPRGAPRSISVVTGPSGAGRTSLLEAIVAAKETVAPYGAVVGPTPVRRGAASARLEARWLLDDEERARGEITETILSTTSVIEANGAIETEHDPAFAAILGAYDADPARFKVDYFDADRRFDLGGPYLGQALDHTLRLSRDPRKYAGVVPFLRRIAAAPDNSDGTPWLRFALAFRKLVKERIFLGTSMVAGRERLLFSDAAGRGATPEDLSGAHKQALIFASCCVRFGLDRSLVLVDTPELGIPCDEVPRFVRAIERLVPHGQLVIATGSRELVSSFDASEVITLGARAA